MKASKVSKANQMSAKPKFQDLDAVIRRYNSLSPASNSTSTTKENNSNVNVKPRQVDIPNITINKIETSASIIEGANETYLYQATDNLINALNMGNDDALEVYRELTGCKWNYPEDDYDETDIYENRQINLVEKGNRLHYF